MEKSNGNTEEKVKGTSIEWTTKSGNVIKTNDRPESIQRAKDLGWSTKQPEGKQPKAKG